MHILTSLVLVFTVMVGITFIRNIYCDLKFEFDESKKLKEQLNKAIENNSEQIKEFGGISKVKISAIKKLIVTNKANLKDSLNKIR